jgi:hypothetical protein
MGWAGLSMVCYGDPLSAARASCSGTPGCQGVAGEPTGGPGGSLALSATTSAGSTWLYVQPCDRLEAGFFNATLAAYIPAVIAILCARHVLRQWQSHS